MSEPRECPFCGNPVEHESTITEEVIRCTMCPAKMVYDGSYAALFAMWNTRRPQAIDRDAGDIATILDECEPILTHGFARFKAEAMDRIAALSRPVDSMERVKAELLNIQRWHYDPDMEQFTTEPDGEYIESEALDNVISALSDSTGEG